MIALGSSRLISAMLFHGFFLLVTWNALKDCMTGKLSFIGMVSKVSVLAAAGEKKAIKSSKKLKRAIIRINIKLHEMEISSISS